MASAAKEDSMQDKMSSRDWKLEVTKSMTIWGHNTQSMSMVMVEMEGVT